MIEFRLSPCGLGRTRFAYSPLAEVASSVRLLSSGRLPIHHRPWYDDIRSGLRTLDWPVLHAVAPYRHELPGFLVQGAQGTDTSIKNQLGLIEAMPAAEVGSDIRRTWNGDLLPDCARSVIADPEAPSRVVAALWDYWVVALQPYWNHVQSALDDDLSRRLSVISAGGIECIFPTLDRRLWQDGDRLVIDKKDQHVVDVAGIGIQLVPSIFVWPHLAVAHESWPQPTLMYAARNARLVWTHHGRSGRSPDAVLSALIGSSRATILQRLDLGQTTAALAHDLDLSRPAVSQHLTQLRRNGLVESRRIGKRVIYQRTEIAERMIRACEKGGGTDS